MKALLLALFISTHTLAAIPLSGDDERSINNISKMAMQNVQLKEMTKKLNLAIFEYAKVRDLADQDYALELNNIASELTHLNDHTSELSPEYLKALEEDIDYIHQDLIEMR
ncbi:hypothetical protein ABMA70_01875 [Halobacteriovorax sp. XZX-3]|uniref:hypothetical protein n=1 Tax=unclassified Halobacteriovorax TaxID=2639665 RepID=UPI003721F70C